jgi:hypothetical protein
MKKIIIIILISTISSTTLSQGIFNFKIPQPDFISNDWDNDGDPNSTDPDDDNDGIDDVDDSVPFGLNGQNSTPDVNFSSFSSNKTTYDIGENIVLNWTIYNPRSLNLYYDSLFTNHIDDVDGLNTYTVNNIQNDQEIYLNYETGNSVLNLYVWNFNSSNCGTYSPSADTITSGESFTQSRTCNEIYTSNEPNSKTVTVIENQNAIGTKIGVCHGSNTYYFIYMSGGNVYLKWYSTWHSGPLANPGNYYTQDTFDNYALLADGYRYWFNGYMGNQKYRVCRALDI